MRLAYRPSARAGEYLRKITCDHWEDAETLVGTHVAIIRHKATGHTVGYPLHDGGNDLNGPRNMAAEIEKTCGCHLIEHRGRKQSRKPVTVTDFSIERARRESERFAESVADQVDGLLAERDRLIGECECHSNFRSQLRYLPPKFARIAEIESVLRRLSHPVESFDPFSLVS